MAASPMSPQECTEAAVAAMQSESILSPPTDAQTAQTGNTNLPPPQSVSTKRDFDPVPVIEPPPVLCSPATAVAAPVSIPVPTGLTPTTTTTTTVSPPTVQASLQAPAPRVEPPAVDRNMIGSYSAFHATELPVATAPQPTMPRPLGAFSYTSPAVSTSLLASTDRYIPAIGFSPSRTRVARDPPVEPPLMGHLRRPSYPLGPLPLPPMPPQQPTVSRQADPALVYTQEPPSVSSTPAVPASVSSAATRDLTGVDAHSTWASYGPGVSTGGAYGPRVPTGGFYGPGISTGGVYGPGVTSTPLAAETTATHPSVTTTATLVHVLPQTEPTPPVTAYTAGPPKPTIGQLQPTGALPAYTAQLSSPAEGEPRVSSVPPSGVTTDFTVAGLAVDSMASRGAAFSSTGSTAAPAPAAPTAATVAASQSGYVYPRVAESASAQSMQAVTGNVFTSPHAATQEGLVPGGLVSGGLVPEGLVPGGLVPGGMQPQQVSEGLLVSGSVQHQQVPGGLVPGSQGIAPGPLQAGQTTTPGPVAEGQEEDSLLASDSDAWSDADSALAEPLSQAWHERSAQPGPVCEGVETNSDVWSDSASSDPGTPVSSGQAAVDFGISAVYASVPAAMYYAVPAALHYAVPAAMHAVRCAVQYTVPAAVHMLHGPPCCLLLLDIPMDIPMVCTGVFLLLLHRHPDAAVHAVPAAVAILQELSNAGSSTAGKAVPIWQAAVQSQRRLRVIRCCIHRSLT